MKKLPTWLRAAVTTGLQTLAGLVLLGLLDLALDVQDWVADPTNPVDFSTFAKLVVAAVITFLSGLVTAVYRYLKPIETSYPEMGVNVPVGEAPAQITVHGVLYQRKPTD